MQSMICLAGAGGILIAALTLGNPFLPQRPRPIDRPAAGQRAVPVGQLVGFAPTVAEGAVQTPEWIDLGSGPQRVVDVHRGAAGEPWFVLGDGREVRRVPLPASAPGGDTFRFEVVPVTATGVGPASAVPAALPAVLTGR